jgi:hypothetical protein
MQTIQNQQPTEWLRHHEPAIYAFQHIHVDRGEHLGKHYLFTVAKSSNIPHIFKCGQKSVTQHIIDSSVRLITHFFVPEIIYSDGEPQFLDNGKFEDFCRVGHQACVIIITLHAPIKWYCSGVCK